MISVAVQKGSYVFVYNENNLHILTKNGELAGYTSSSFSVKNGNIVYTFNEKGMIISQHSC